MRKSSQIYIFFTLWFFFCFITGLSIGKRVSSTEWCDSECTRSFW